MDRIYYTPRGLVPEGVARELMAMGQAAPFLDGGFTSVQITRIANGALTQSMRALTGGVGPQIAVPRSFAGCDVTRPLVMGVVNVTPDSFSDGGHYLDPKAAIDHGLRLLDEGADILDVGGESTRPGAAPVPVEDERARVLPVVQALAARGAVVSIDTRHALTMTASVEAGAKIINDVAALTGPGALAAAAATRAAVVLMHMQGEPTTMQDAPSYGWAPGDIYDMLAARIAACEAAGIARERISVDPGIGFGKSDAHNVEIFDHLAMFAGLGCVITMGASRKGFIGRASRGEPPAQRVAGSVAAALLAVERGARILRVHDVAETRQALAVWERLRGSGSAGRS